MSLRDVCDVAYVLLLDEVRSDGSSVSEARDAVDEWLSGEATSGMSEGAVAAMAEIDQFRASRGAGVA